MGIQEGSETTERRADVRGCVRSLFKMSGFIQMPEGHPGALGTATVEKEKAASVSPPAPESACTNGAGVRSPVCARM